MIVKRNGNYYLYSRTVDPKLGRRRRLGGPYRTRAAAVRRERQVQYFKHKGR